MRPQLLARKKKLYQMLFEFTAGQCTACALTGCACKDIICKHVEEQAAKQGERFEHTGHRLRFIGQKGCVVPPHLRETCTIYICQAAQQASGFQSERYQRLLRLIEKVEWKLMSVGGEDGQAIAKNHNLLKA